VKQRKVQIPKGPIQADGYNLDA